MSNNFIFKNIEEAPVDSLDLNWAQLDISKQLKDVIAKEFKFDKMTPVQAATIPLMLNNKDVIVEAKTGSGKTLAFLIPLVELLIRRNRTKPIESHETLALILSPTRELALQIHQELRKILRNKFLFNDKEEKNLGSLLIVGGNSVKEDIQKYNKYGANMIVATPGRLSGIMEMADNSFSASLRKNLSYLIFDEADQLLSFGFEANLSSILNYLPKQRRTSLFSATQTNEVEELIKSGMRNPIKIDVNQLDPTIKKSNIKTSDCDVTKKLQMPNKLENYYFVCRSYAHKLATLIELLRGNEYKKVIVFVSTCSQIDYFAQSIESELNDKKRPILKLHRRLKNKRKSIFKQLKTSKRCILLATDILSRGIDVPEVECVIHLDLPTSPECYVHRSGRSGHQIELSGISLLLLEKHELDYIEMCRRRHILLEPMSLKHFEKETDEKSCARLSSTLKERAIKDEKFQTLGLQAFVSYLRYYSSKLCLRELLFPKLPKAQLAISFGLVRLPKMPELKSNYKSISSEFEEASLSSTGHMNLDKGA